MNQFDYLIPFVGIIYALSATDLLVSAHRLIIERRRITFHSVPIIWAVTAFLLIINAWWQFFEINKNIELKNAGQLFLLSLLPMIIFMISSFSLPHKIDDNFSMWDYYNDHKKPLFFSHILYILMIPAVLGLFVETINTLVILRSLGFSLIFVSLLWINHWVWHLLVGLTMMTSLLYSIFQQTIGI